MRPFERWHTHAETHQQTDSHTHIYTPHIPVRNLRKDWTFHASAMLYSPSTVSFAPPFRTRAQRHMQTHADPPKPMHTHTPCASSPCARQNSRPPIVSMSHFAFLGTRTQTHASNADPPKPIHTHTPYVTLCARQKPRLIPPRIPNEPFRPVCLICRCARKNIQTYTPDPLTLKLTHTPTHRM